MKELLRSLPDGANDFGNGVIGPSLLDIQRANATPSFENLKTQETRTKDNGDLIFVFSESKLGEFFKGVFRKAPKRFILPAGAVLSLVAVACSGGGVGEKNSSSQELEKRESGYSLPFPEGETWFLTNGPHGDGSSNGIRNAIDIAPPELGVLNGDCPTDGSRLSIDNRVVTASASGEVTIKGNDKNRDDPFHSIVDIKDNNGLTQRFVHLDNTRVKLGDKVNQGEALGNPSCEFPPDGANTGPHVHIALMKDDQAIPIDGVVVGGWTIHKDGTMTKPGEQTRTANTGRLADPNGTKRNDLPNNPNKAVLASPKNPIPPISATITSKKAESPTPTSIPTPKPTEFPKPAAAEKEPKSLEEQAKLLALNNFLNLLSATQKGKGVHDDLNRATYTLDSKIVQDMRASKTDIIQGKQSQDSDRLVVRWTTSFFDYFETFSNKNLGEAEMKQFKLLATATGLTAADKENGIQWRGRVAVGFIARWRVTIPFFPGSDYKYYGSDEEWAKVAVEPNGQYSQWNDNGGLGFPFFDLELRNGQWQTQTSYFPSHRYAYDHDVNYPIAAALTNKRCLIINRPEPVPGCVEAPATPK